MVFQVLVIPVILVHLAFIAFVVGGGFLAWRWPRVFVAHVFAVAWGAVSVLVGVDCPLTNLENWLRRLGGMVPLPSTGFIDHYLTGVIYPASAIHAIQLVALVAVLISWSGLVARRRSSTPVRSR